MFTVGGNHIRSIVVKVLVNGTPLTMELDTGAAVSLVLRECVEASERSLQVVQK